MRSILGCFILLILLTSCRVEKEKATENINLNVPDFNADSAYHFIERQVNFGPRVPNSPAHKETGDYLIEKLKSYGATITVQSFEAVSYNNQPLNLRNIIASLYPERSRRVLLAAHWDTRPFADKDKYQKDTPIDGANDGASGVGILLEIARAVSTNDSLQVGVDIILFDGEDGGEPIDTESNTNYPAGINSWWCLGSQYWSSHKHKKNYSAEYGILLDMVGAKRSQFFREGVSVEYAPQILDKVWTIAHRIGYSDYFINQNKEAIIDDHVFVNQLAKIPMIDIVHYQSGIGYFGEYHHTLNDKVSIISKETLNAVGSTLLHVIYNEGR